MNINWQPSHLENDLVKLVPLHDNDFEKLFAVASDPKIWEQHPTYDRYQCDVFENTFFKSAMESKTAFLIIDKKNGEVIGSTRYYDDKPEESSIAIGYTFIACKYWGGKYNFSIKKLMLDYAFQFANKVYLHIGIDNMRSQMATAKLGAKKVRDFTQETNGRMAHNIEVVIEKTDWLKKK